jgi:hypothetical protein
LEERAEIIIIAWTAIGKRVLTRIKSPPVNCNIKAYKYQFVIGIITKTIKVSHNAAD